MGLSIIIPTHNRVENLNRLVNALCSFEFTFECEIIIVNDVIHQDLSLKNTSKVQVFSNEKGGVASSRNIGVSNAKFPYFLFIDDDMLVTKEAIEYIYISLKKNASSVYNLNWTYPHELIKKCNSSKFGRYLIHTNYTSLKGWMGNETFKISSEYTIHLGTSCFLGISKEIFDKTGRYNETFPYAGFEDHHFFKALEKLKVTTKLNTSITNYHNEEQNIFVENWLNRQEKNAHTRRVSVDLFPEDQTKIHYSNFKSMVLKTLLILEKPYRFFLYLIPNNAFFDSIYRFAFKPLLAARVFKGYQS